MNTTITLNEKERPSFVDMPVCYQECCFNYDSSDIYNIDYEFDQYFGDKPYLKKYFQTHRFTKNQVTTLFYTPTHFNICDAIIYVSNCHCCGAKLNYGEIYELFEWRLYKQFVCSKECETKMRDENTQCYFGESCKMCHNGNISYHICDCYRCNIDGDEEVNHFNRLHETCYSSKVFEKLKKYAKTNMITLRDSIFYAQNCHNCRCDMGQGDGSMFGNTYCSDYCETQVELYECECCNSIGYLYHDDMECNICLNPDKTAAFNVRYNVEFDDDSIKEIKYYAKIHEMTIRDAIDYYNDKYNTNNNEILFTTEDAGILSDEDDDMPPLTRATVDRVLIAKMLLPDEVTLRNFNISGPATKTGLLDSDTWDEIEDLDGDVYYLRRGFYRFVSSGPPAPRDGMDWYEIGGNFYVVNQVNKKS
jgi:hypothetical protein